MGTGNGDGEERPRSHQILRFVLVAVNVFFVIIGAVVLAMALYVIINSSLAPVREVVFFSDTEAVERGTTIFENGAYVFVGVGLITCIVAIIGIAGALRESECLLYTYGTLLVICLLITVATVIVIIFYQAEINEQKEAFLAASITQYTGLYIDDRTPVKARLITEAWDSLQILVECCGIYNGTDWSKYASTWINRHAQNNSRDVLVPQSCCRSIRYDCRKTPTNTNSFINTGCNDAFAVFLKKWTNVMVAIGICAALLELLGIVLACLLCNSINKVQKGNAIGPGTYA